MTKNARMTEMRLRARVQILDEDLDDLSGISTTALWEVARIAHRRSMSHVLADIVTELFRRMDYKGHPLTLRLEPVSDTPAGSTATVPETPTDTRGNVSETHTSPTDTLSDRDRRVLELHRQGAAKRAIARHLGMPESTVRGLIKRLTGSTGA